MKIKTVILDILTLRICLLLLVVQYKYSINVVNFVLWVSEYNFIVFYITGYCKMEHMQYAVAKWQSFCRGKTVWIRIWWPANYEFFLFNFLSFEAMFTNFPYVLLTFLTHNKAFLFRLVCDGSWIFTYICPSKKNKSINHTFNHLFALSCIWRDKYRNILLQN